MDKALAKDNASAQETKRLPLRLPLTVQTIMHDATGPATFDTYWEQGTSSRISQNESEATPDFKSIVSPVSSNDTFATAYEYTKSKEDCTSVGGSSISSKPASPVPITSKPTVIISEIEPATQGPKEVASNIECSSTLAISQHCYTVPITTNAEPQSDLKLATSPAVDGSQSRQSQGFAVPLNCSQNNSQSPTKTSTQGHSINSPSTSFADDMTNITKKAAQRQARRDKADRAVLASINEEDSVEKFTTDHRPSEKLTIDKETSDMAAADTSSTRPQVQNAAATRTRKKTKTSKANNNSAPSTSTAPSMQAIDVTMARIAKHPQHGSLMGRQSRPGQMSANLLASPWLFTYDHPHVMTNCYLSSCERPTASSDGRTVICPRCGDRSYVRYCSVTHLIADIRDHYITICGRRENLLRIDESTITPVRQPTREFIRAAAEEDDSSERHRQALYHAYPPESDITTSTRPAADYYVFSDADRFQATDLPATTTNLYPYRCTGSIAGRVRYEQTDHRKALFATLLQRLLVMGTSAGRTNPKGCRMLFMWIKENLEDQGDWTEIMITRMCLATQMEFGWHVDMDLRE